jgi:ubiquinone/menaquinone biosynthesis C-methylase UbiE
VGFYSRVIFPRLCDWVLRRPAVTRLRRQLLSQAAGDVLEIGLGTGLNLPHYGPGVKKITAVEPNVGMHRLAQRRIARLAIEVEPCRLSAERLPFDDGAFDCAVTTFTLCSIDSVEQALRELFRVLRPGGQLLLLEHGLSPEPAVQWWQRRLSGLQRWLADRCRLDRDMRALVSGQPFRRVGIEEFYLPRVPRTHGYLYCGAAWK